MNINAIPQMESNFKTNVILCFSFKFTRNSNEKSSEAKGFQINVMNKKIDTFERK